MTSRPTDSGRESYYDLPDESQWLGSGSLDSPEQVGGWCTEVTQVGYSIAQCVQRFGLMDDPAVAQALLTMHRSLAAAEQALDDAFAAINAAVQKQTT